MQTGRVYLIPNLLGEGDVNQVIPPNVKEIVNLIDNYIVEDVRSARRYLRKLDIQKPIDQLQFTEIDKHAEHQSFIDVLNKTKEGFNIGVISEAGCPAVADPGSLIVKEAHHLHIEVIPLVGPSSILLALMASGMNGQNFAFNGYLPVRNPERANKLSQLEAKIVNESQTQLFIETPYRNQSLLNDIVQKCNPALHLCIATDLSLGSQIIKVKTIAEWRKSIPDINKKLCIFVLGK